MMKLSSEATKSSDKVTLLSVLSDGRKSLASTNEQRIVLQQEIQRKFEELNQIITDYWVTQAKGFQQSDAKVGDHNDGREWRAEFATQEVRNAEAAAAKQKQLWSQIDRMVQDAKDYDDKFWASWQNSLHHLGTPDESQDRSLSPRVDEFPHQPRRAERSTRATAKVSASHGPTAFSASRDKSRLTKSAISVRPTAVPKSSGPASSARATGNGNKPFLPESSNPPKSAASTANVKARGTTTRQEKSNRTTRPVTAKFSTKQSPARTPRPKKRRVDQTAKTRVNPQPVTDPKPGHLYQAYYHSANPKERGWYMGTVLPWQSDDWAKELMINISMSDMDLETDWPECCQPGYNTQSFTAHGEPLQKRRLTCITKWMPGFEDGGPRIMDRKFLFLFFEDRPNKLGCLDIDPTEPMALIRFKLTGEPVPIDWVDAKDLRAWDLDDDMPVRGLGTAEKYRNKLDHVARLREQARNANRAVASLQPVGSPDGMTGCFSTSKGLSPPGPSEVISHGQPEVGRQQDGRISPTSSLDHIEVLSGQRPLNREQGKVLPDLSPGQMDIDEAYEELPQTYTKRVASKRLLDNDPEEYDEGLGMDYDLSLKRSAFQMSCPQTSVAGLPPHKLPRLDDYDIPGPSAAGSGLRSPETSDLAAGVSFSGTGSSPTPSFTSSPKFLPHGRR